MHSKKYDIVKHFYDRKEWSLSRVRDAVGRWITEEEFYEITGIIFQQ